MKCTLRIIGISTIVFFLEFINIKWFFYNLGFVPSEALYKPWMFITSLFIHANFLHLFLNMLALFFFGTYFESKYGSRNFLKLYFLAGILGNVAYYIYDPTSNIPGVGASGAVYGILGALSVLEPFMIVYLNFIPVPMIVAAFIWIITNLVGMIFSIGNVGYQAHLAGLFVGIFYGYMLKKRKHKTIEMISDYEFIDDIYF